MKREREKRRTAALVSGVALMAIGVAAGILAAPALGLLVLVGMPLTFFGLS